MRIDCRDCEMYRTQHCDDCLVTALLGPLGPVELDEELDPSLSTLSTAGLIPVLKFRPRVENASGDDGEERSEAG